MSKKKDNEYFMAKKMGRAINLYGMIEAGDRVLVAVSGGKDSYCMLRLLMRRRQWIPVDYEIRAVHVISDYEKHRDSKARKVKELFEGCGCDTEIVTINIAGADTKARENCFWCSWNRRKAIFELAAEKGFNKVALGHHQDDIAETILMNMFFNGEISSINPYQELFNGKIKLIRPMVMFQEKEIVRLQSSYGADLVETECSRSGDSKRALVREILRDLYKQNSDIKTNILRAPSRIRTDYIPRLLGEGKGDTV
jgi:tRNA 2-thiocytidine biosynthesis protein TtcA